MFHPRRTGDGAPHRAGFAVHAFFIRTPCRRTTGKPVTANLRPGRLLRQFANAFEAARRASGQRQRPAPHRDNMASRVAKSHFSKLEYHNDTPYSDREMLWLF